MKKTVTTFAKAKASGEKCKGGRNREKGVCMADRLPAGLSAGRVRHGLSGGDRAHGGRQNGRQLPGVL